MFIHLAVILDTGGTLSGLGRPTEHREFVYPVKIKSNFGCKQPQVSKLTECLSSAPRIHWAFQKLYSSAMLLNHPKQESLEIRNISHWQQDWLHSQSIQTINTSCSPPISCQRSWCFREAFKLLVLHPKQGTSQESLNSHSKNLFKEVFTQATFLYFLSLPPGNFCLLRYVTEVMFLDWQLSHNEKQVTINKAQN